MTKTIENITSEVREFLKRKGARTSDRPRGWTRMLTGAVGYGVEPDDTTWERLAAVTDYHSLVVHQILVFDDPTLMHTKVTIFVSDYDEPLGISRVVECEDQR